MSILVVDDDRAIREMLIESLRDEGYRVEAAGDGVEALSYLRGSAETPCLSLLDLMMPRMDGWQFLAEQRATSNLAAIPVVVLSARPDGYDQAQLLRVSAYIPKPIDFALLFDAARRFCSHCVVASGAAGQPAPLHGGSGH